MKRGNQGQPGTLQPIPQKRLPSHQQPQGWRVVIGLGCSLLCWSCASSAQPLANPKAMASLLTEDTSTSSAIAIEPEDTDSAIEEESETPTPEPTPVISPDPAPSPAVELPQPTPLIQGQTIQLNGKRFDIPWLQWQDGNSVGSNVAARERLGISDVAVEQLLNLQLLSTDNPTQQPIQGFINPETTTLTAFVNYPYRYLDLATLAERNGLTLKPQGDTLFIDLPTARVADMETLSDDAIALTLDRPTLWRIEQTDDRAVLVLESTTAPTLASEFPVKAEPLSLELATVTTQDRQTHFTFQLPAGQKLRVTEAQNPPRLIVQASDTPASTFVERNIQWTPGVWWRQQWVNLGSDRFPAFILELDPRAANLALRPIWSNPNAMNGIERLDSMARRWEAAAAINGGFFNRDTKLPLGAVRRDDRWFSGPILYRGAVAWDDQGNVAFARLYLQETLTTASQQRIPILYLNSGYVQAGVSRYTSEWGPTYTPLTNNETIIIARGDRVVEQYAGGAANSTSFPIPADGQLLTIRANSIPADWLTVGTQFQIESKTVPAELANYPNIIGAGPMLLQNRQIVLDAASEKFSAAFIAQAAPRSIIARSDRGTLLIIALHNRENGRGPTLAETAQLVQRLGAIDALNLDGGSSTSLYLGGQLIDRAPNTAARVHNGIGLYLLAPQP
jgi:hypothetical protein